ncbi:MAG TPA: hypothetical protein VHK67_04035 [Rhabdochlamydiaceae bacterium]|jgi:hypothetical protein|nr:hypothetical protein [Rhabdochlamydiaceae bacterium]
MTLACQNVTYSGQSLIASGVTCIPHHLRVSDQATIDKTHLRWLDICKLLNAFPQHIQLVGETVVFQGPVGIGFPISSTRQFIVHFQLVVTVGTLLFIFARSITWLISKIKQEPLSEILGLSLSIFCLAVSVCGPLAALGIFRLIVPLNGAIVFPGNQPIFYA